MSSASQAEAPDSGVWEVTGEASMVGLGMRLGALLRPGDLVLLDGPLGAGKTTLTRGIAAGLGVPGPVTSPTFVLAREHAAPDGRAGLVHVDAYRLAGPDEVEDLDLGPAMAQAVTVVEWGVGAAEQLAEDRLELTLVPLDEDRREVRWAAVGERWKPDLSRVAGCGAR